jgi:hypothetical protein
MNSCIHCGISFDFYEEGFFFIESNKPKPNLPQKYEMINDYLDTSYMILYLKLSKN